MADKPDFKGYIWEGLRTTYRPNAELFGKSVDWDALCRYASKLNNDETCTMDPQITMGGRNLVRIINFANGTRWVARFRMPSSHKNKNYASDRILKQEVDCMQLVKKLTDVPVPTVFGYIASPANAIGGAFILMECLSGNAAVKLQHRESMSAKQKKSFYDEIARFQTEFSSITFPKIGSLTQRDDGTWDIGPLPGLGGPFDTASEYLEAWADAAKFYGLEGMKAAYGEECSNQLEASILAFPPRLKKLAATIPIRNHGPFPLIHPDFALWNVVVDDDYKILGVIDWEFAHSGPWEMVHFPKCFMPAPAPMALSAWYNEDGMPVDNDLKESFKEMKEYVDVVRWVEQAKGLSPTLSAVLGDRAGQDLAFALHLYVDGKHGKYSKVLDVHHERWAGGNEGAEEA